ncbi:MAG: methylcobamide:CoM methyltransferase MtaA [Methanolobus sp.]
MELSWLKLIFDPHKMATLAIAGFEIAGLEAVRIPFCTSVIAETLGCTFDKGSIDMQPFQTDFPCKNKDDVKSVSIPDNLLESRRIKTVLDAVEDIKKKISEDVPVIAGMIGPAATAFYLCGAKNYLKWCITAPDLLSELMNTGTDVCIEYANALFDRGIDAVVIIDSEAGPDLLPPPLFESLVLPEYRKLTENMRGKKIVHICGDATSILDLIAESGFDGLSIEEKVDMANAKRIVGDRICLIGNVSPAATLLSRSPENIQEEAKQCIKDGVDILAPGCGIAPRTPIKNIKAFVASRDEYYR